MISIGNTANEHHRDVRRLSLPEGAALFSGFASRGTCDILMLGIFTGLIQQKSEQLNRCVRAAMVLPASADSLCTRGTDYAVGMHIPGH